MNNTFNPVISLMLLILKRKNILISTLHSAMSCSAPSLQIYDGDSVSFPLVGTFCGNVIPAAVASTSNFLTVHFVTDSSVNRRGFNATYRSADSKPLPQAEHCALAQPHRLCLRCCI